MIFLIFGYIIYISIVISEEKMDKIIVVNGRQYFEATGIPVDSSQPNSLNREEKSTDIHQGLQKSQTLNRRFVKQPAPRTSAQMQQIQQFKRKHDYEEAKKRAEEMNMAAAKLRAANSPKIARFNPGKGSADRIISPIKIEKDSNNSQIEKPSTHPIQQKIEKTIIQQTEEKAIPSSRELKISAINQALEKAQAEEKARKKSRGSSKKSFWKVKKFVGFAAGFSVVVMSVGYLTYINLPSISTKVAAAQAGIEATLPAYSPSGYQLDGLASFDGKSVNINYKKDGYAFTLKQSQSPWDSIALLNNYVSDEWNGNYLTTQEKGLTIYTNDGNAAWVNNGMLYTISGDTSLNNDQIRKIATSF